MIAPALTDDEVVDLIARKVAIERPKLRRPMAMCELDLSLEEYFAVLVEIEDRFDIDIDDLIAVDCPTLGGLIDRFKASVSKRGPRPLRYA